MARIRSIKPGFFTSLDIAELRRETRLHFAGLWTYADDHGRGVDDPRLLKAAIWPLDDDITTDDIERMQDELVKHDRITRYSAGDRRYFQIHKWPDHQKPNRPQPSTLPAPSDGVPLTPLAESVNDHGTITDPTRQEGRVEEGRGEEPSGRGADAPAPLVDRVASWLAKEHGVEFEESPNLHGMYDAVMRKAMPLLEGKKRHDTAMGLVCDYAAAVNGEKVPSGHRARIGRLLKAHLPEHVLYGVAQSMDWGAGLTGEHAKDPDAWLNYVTAVVTKREAA